VRAAQVELDLARIADWTACALAWPRRPSGERESCGATSRLARARRELTAVHRAELALLLRRAAAARLAGEDDPGVRAGLREALELAAREGWRWPRALERLLRRLIAGEPVRWPEALRLARVAQALAPSLAARVLAAEALARAGRTRAALAELSAAALRLPARARPRSLTSALARHAARAAREERDARLARACGRLARALAEERAA